MKNIAILILFLSSLVASAQTVTLPFTQSHGLMLVQIEVNGTPATMLFDTGAAHTVISLPLAGLKASLPQLKSTANGTGGQAFDVQADIKLCEVKFSHADVIAANVDNVSRDLGVHVDGILGIDVTGKFKTVTIDFKAKTITLTK